VLDPDETPSTPPEERARGLSRGLTVGGYEGLRASEAIVAVRTAGLRPSLERVEGYEEALHGSVVSQDPSSGAVVAADTQVFIYVATPARAIVSRDVPPEAEVEDTEPSEGFDDQHPAEEERFEEPATQEFESVDTEELPELDEEPAEPIEGSEWVDEEPGEPGEPVRVWRGPAPGAVPRRRLTSSSSRGRRSWWGSLPLGVQLAAVGLFVCVALTLLLGLASQVHSPSRARSTVAGRPAASAPAPAPRAPSPVDAPLRPVPRPPRRPSASHRAVRSPRLVTVAPPPTPSVSAPSPAAPLTGAAADEHAAREFGP
jgi:hypothetical protein